ncbi:MAG: trehalose-phosphatase [bacterium]
MTTQSASRSVRTRPAASLPQPQLDWAYFFDVDGTLADIEQLPEDVRIRTRVRATIDRLYDATGGAVALVSGRTVVDIDRLYPGSKMPLSGQHGVEWRNATGLRVSPTHDMRLLDRVRAALSDAVSRSPGLMLQDKGYSLALHYRQAPHMAAYAHHLMRAAQATLGSDFAVMRGKRIVEIKPAFSNKGTAVAQLMTIPAFAGRIPVFVGDDITDEYGFSAVNEMHGISVKIGTGPTVANWRLRDITELMTWLSRVP